MRFALFLLVLLAAALPSAAAAEQASQPTSPEAGYITTGFHHSCALHAATVRCWGYAGEGRLGYGNNDSIGDNESPGSVGSVAVGRGATAVSAGSEHTCALLDNATVRCWGFGANGRLGYGNAFTIGDNEPPDSVGPVDLGAGRTAKAISAGDGHTCAVLDNDTLRCWGYGFDGRLGYNNTDSIGDTESPGSKGPVDFGPGLTVKAVSAGNAHTCAILSDNTVRCWGFAASGRLGYGNANCLPQGQGGQCPIDVGRGCYLLADNTCPPNPAAPTPASVGPVNLGPGRTAKAISAGQFHTCAVLDNDTVRCWGAAASGRLGTGASSNIGDDETPDAVPPVDLGPGRTAKAITAGGEHTCALLDNNTVRCWGAGSFGQLGYGNPQPIGDNESPGSVGPVNLGTGRTAKAVSAGLFHTCARLDNDSVRCWGYGANGRLGYCNEHTIGEDESPGSVGPVGLPVSGGACPGAVQPTPRATNYRLVTTPDPLGPALAAQRTRAAAMQSCLRSVRRRLRRDLRRARRLPSSRERGARRRARRRAARRRRACRRLHGRIPGQVTTLSATALGGRRVQLNFQSVGTDGTRLPAATSYLVKQSRRRIRSARGFRRAQSLCRGRCSFRITRVGASLSLTVTGLPRNRVLYYAIAARDNVSGRLGPRSRTIGVRVR